MPKSIDLTKHKPTADISETPSFKCKCSWKPPQGKPSLELILSHIEK